MGRASNRKKARRQQRRQGSGPDAPTLQRPTQAPTPKAMPQEMLLKVAGAVRTISQEVQARQAEWSVARQLWGDGEEPEIPSWPDDSLGDRFFSDYLAKQLAKAPRLSTAKVVDPRVIAADPAHWEVATWALIRAVILDGLTVDDPAVRGLLDTLAPVVDAELAYDALLDDGWVGEPEFPEDSGPVSTLGLMALTEATWALVGDDPLREILNVLVPVLDGVEPVPPGRTIADALVGAFAEHFRCEQPGDAEELERIGGWPGGNALVGLVETKEVAPNDVLRIGLKTLAVIADLCSSEAVSVLPPQTESRPAR